MYGVALRHVMARIFRMSFIRRCWRATNFMARRTRSHGILYDTGPNSPTRGLPGVAQRIAILYGLPSPARLCRASDWTYQSPCSSPSGRTSAIGGIPPAGGDNWRSQRNHFGINKGTAMKPDYLTNLGKKCQLQAYPFAQG